jgi:hypothetical protein
MQPVSKALYLGGYLVGWGMGIGMMIIGVVLDEMQGKGKSAAGPSAICMGLLVMLMGGILYLVFIGKMWSALQRGPIRPRATPGQAVGFLFIPFYNLYWIFQAIHGWTQDYNRYVQKANLDVPRMPEGLALSICIVQLCTLIPVVGYLMHLVQIVLTAVFINFACDGINALLAAREYQRGDGDQPGDERFSADNPFT